ncbi:virulence-associated E family protein [Corynebacterium glutamicum]|uniref:virulence-associated E family protein n=1 Tax=Corynebacterium glutamicum TaxID=1718 RepID=UPI001B8D42F0|nr:virulence-associated E family protein [Corynebacterium glutamicum]
MLRQRPLKISTAPRRTSPQWNNKTTDKQSLIAQLCQPLAINHTVAEYHNLPKAEKDQAKDVGGYVGGHLKDGLRRKGHAYSRSFITLDLDEAPHNLPDHLKNTWTHAWFATTTASHTPEKPRWRIIIWLTRDITSDEYSAISRKLAEQINPELTWIDPTTFQAERFMYWSATCTDGEFLTATSQKEAADINPDAILATYDNWNDLSTWPGVTAEEARRIEHAGTKVEDPRTKHGILGAFNRTYTIEQAIKEFLPDVYKPGTTKNRWTYTGGSSSNGLIIYDSGLHCYSQHATDPASEQMVNAFDLVRIHKFGHLDTDAKPNTPINRMPSTAAMTDLALNDHATKLTNTADIQAQIGAVFSPIPQDTTETPEAEESLPDDHNPDQTPATQDFDWLATLDTKREGGFKDTLHNFETIFTHDPRYNHIAWNAHEETLAVQDPQALPWKQLKPGWTDNDIAQLQTTISNSYNGLYSPTRMETALLSTASKRAFHPVRDYFNNLLPWDGIPRLDTLLTDYLGAPNTPYTNAVTRKTLVAAVRRTYRPGTKFDTVLTLAGPQGIGKSTIFAKLAGKWFSDSLSIPDMKDKDGAEKLAGNLINEVAELAGMRKMDAETLKAFISRAEDKYRPAYGRTVQTYPRQGIIVGSTNAKEGFLRDPTGGRRFWVVEVTGEGPQKTWDMDTYTIDQIWAEAIHHEKKGEVLYLEGEIAEAALHHQKEAIEADDRVGLVLDYLSRALPASWEDLPLSARLQWLDSESLPSAYQHDIDWGKGLITREAVSKIEIWSECFRRKPEDMERSDSYAISAIMSQLDGWEDNGKSRRLNVYGKQRVFDRIGIDIRKSAAA